MATPMRTLLFLSSFALLAACGEDQDRYMLDDAGMDGAESDGDTDATTEVDANVACGNGNMDEGETCDDGNAVTEACAYGEASCTVCSASCQSVAGVTSVCGDGNLDTAHEACDADHPLCTDTCELDCDKDADLATLTSMGCYLFYGTTALTQPDAEAACVTLGGHLVAFESQAEIDVLRQAWDLIEGEGEGEGSPEGFVGLRFVDHVPTSWTNGAPFLDTLDLDISTDEGESTGCASGDAYGIWEDDCENEGAYFCELGTCGDGVRFSNEGCDDGNAANGDGCDTNCTVTACGNGVRTAGEDCDDGNTEDGDGCPATCAFPCGSGSGANAAQQTSEGCLLAFDTPATHDAATATCAAHGATLLRLRNLEEAGAIQRFSMAREDWGVHYVGLDDLDTEGTFVWSAGEPLTYAPWSEGQPSSMGDGIDCVFLGPYGDLVNTVCQNQYPFFCEIETCGNGMMDGIEDCDDGNQVNGDGCDNDCSATGCGNGIETSGEECDDGNTVDGDECPASCVFPCGNGLDAENAIQTSRGCYIRFSGAESWSGAQNQCESNGATLVRVDAADENRDALRVSSSGEPFWFGLTDDAMEGVFTDASGAPLTYFNFSPNEPNDTSHVENCGEMGPGGHWNDLGCTQSRRYVCEIATCGNGMVDANEGCDAMDAVDGDGCDTNCTITTCGNGIRTAGEACDDGNQVNGDGCESNCQLPCGTGTGAAAARLSGGVCYTYFTTRVDFDAAEAACAMMGAHLVDITSLSENALVVALAGPDAHIGLTDGAAEDVFLWTSGVLASFTRWAGGEPNDAGEEGEDCVVQNAEGFWNDITCAGERTYVCEYTWPRP